MVVGVGVAGAGGVGAVAGVGAVVAGGVTADTVTFHLFGEVGFHRCSGSGSSCCFAFAVGRRLSAVAWRTPPVLLKVYYETHHFSTGW